MGPMNGEQLWALDGEKAINLESLCLPLQDSAVLGGFGVYETLRQRRGKRYFTADHIRRLLKSAEIIGLKHRLTPELLLGRLDKLRQLNALADMNIRIILVEVSGQANCYVLPTAIPSVAGTSDLEFPEPVGLGALLYSGERQFPQAKSLGLLLSTVALRAAKSRECWDAVLVDSQNQLREGTRSNLLWERGGVLYSPPDEQILSGITREHLLHCAREMGITVRTAVLNSDVFDPEGGDQATVSLALCSTSIALQPVTRLHTLQGRVLQLPPSPVLERLARAYPEYLRNHLVSD